MPHPLIPSPKERGCLLKFPLPLWHHFMKTIFCLFVILITSTLSFAQKTVADTGKVVFVQDSSITNLVAKHIEINKKAKIKGYRVKIHFGGDKSKEKEIKAQFLSKYPDVPAYEKYDQPNFNIRVGDFRTKLEAYKLLKQIQTDFPASFIVQDDIEMPPIDDKPKEK